MLTAEIPETDIQNAKQAKKDAKKAKAEKPAPDVEMEYMMDMMHGEDGAMSPQQILQCQANIIAKAQEYLADHDLMQKLQPLLDKKVKALKGIAGLKQKLSDIQMREARKEDQSG